MNEHEATHKVAVYGSLLSDMGNHRLMDEHEALYRGTIPLEGRLISLGGFPGLVEDEHEHDIHVEVYDVGEYTFGRLDRLEGHPTFYRRKEVDTPIGPAWIYWLQDERYLTHPTVVNNDWKAHHAENYSRVL